ncbi:MAG TPA: DUF493 domain-containing protein [Candidatus Nitrosotenuis sp.]|jgi:putative lipoic acid-binding regulatory protein|nr:DUF493 domain-containing protein [Candidatus Nitrosotenuis sp.]
MASEPRPRESFPEEVMLKVFGRAGGEDFGAHVLGIVQRFVPALGQEALRLRRSRQGRWECVTLTFTVSSQELLEAIYYQLHHDERVVMVL